MVIYNLTLKKELKELKELKMEFVCVFFLKKKVQKF